MLNRRALINGRGKSLFIFSSLILYNVKVCDGISLILFYKAARGRREESNANSVRNGILLVTTPYNNSLFKQINNWKTESSLENRIFPLDPSLDFSFFFSRLESLLNFTLMM